MNISDNKNVPKNNLKSKIAIVVLIKLNVHAILILFLIILVRLKHILADRIKQPI